MKKLIPAIVPLVICCFIVAITLSSAGQGLTPKKSVSHGKVIKLMPPSSIPAETPVTVRQKTDSTTNLVVECSTNLIDWIVLTNIDLSSAQFNPDTGKKELFVQIQLDKSFVLAPNGFFKNILTHDGISTNLPVMFFDHPTTPIPYNAISLAAAGYPYSAFTNKLIHFPHTNVTGLDDAAAIALGIIILVVGIVIVILLYILKNAFGW